MYRIDDLGWVAGGGAAAAPPAFGRLDPLPMRFDVAVDLGDRIGSPRWCRGLATLAAMIAALVHVAPGLPPPLPAPPVIARPIAVRPTQPARIGLAFALEPGGDLASRLIAAGAAAADAASAAALIAGAGPEIDGTRVTAILGPRPAIAAARPIEQVSLRARLDLVLTVARDRGRLALTRERIAIADTPLHVGAPIGTSLYRAMRTAGIPLTTVADYLRAIAHHVDTDEISPGDRFDVVMENRHAATGEDAPGRLLYGALTHDGVRLELLRWTLDGAPHWLDADGAGERRAGLTLPVAGQLTSAFGPRFHPILGYTRLHQGIDLAAPYGTPIVAAAAGMVRFAGWHGGHGNYVLVDHPGNRATGYGHMSAFTVAPGEAVRQGELIGYVGSTGLSTGPHCHFELFENGVAVDPAGADLSVTPRLAGEELARFEAARARYAALPVRTIGS